MASINLYLNFKGVTEQAFTFYKSVFGGEFIGTMRFKDTPEGEKMPPEDAEKIMHMALPIGKESILMGTDVTGTMADMMIEGTNFHISVSADSEADADRIYTSLSAGGQPTMPMSKMFWGDYFGMLTDKFGIQWMVSYNDQYTK